MGVTCYYIINMICKCSQQVQHGTSLHLQYPHYQLTPGLQVTGGGSLEVAGGIQITSGSGAPLQTAQILNTQLQSVSGTAFASQLLLQTPRLGELGYVHVLLAFYMYLQEFCTLAVLMISKNMIHLVRMKKIWTP